MLRDWDLQGMTSTPAAVKVIAGVVQEADCLPDPAQAYLSAARADAVPDLVARAIKDGATGFVSFGTCGGLDPSLPVGTIVVPPALVTETGETWQVDADWHEKLGRVLSSYGLAFVNDQPMAMADSVAVTPPEKAALFAKTAAVAVDLESGPMLRAVGDKMPAVVLRVVSDSAEDSLPTWIGDVVAADGTTDMRALARNVISHPLDLGKLIRLGRTSKVAFEVLSRVAGVCGSRFGF